MKKRIVRLQDNRSEMGAMWRAHLRVPLAAR